MAYADYKAKPKGKDRGQAYVFSTWEHPPTNPALSRTLQKASMVIGNEGTLYSLSRMIWSRCQPHGVQGGILQEANASGKARGYADMKTVTEKVKRQVAHEATHG